MIFVKLKELFVIICSNLPELITFLFALGEQIVTWKMRHPPVSFGCLYNLLPMNCLSCLMQLDCGMLFEGLGSDFLRQSNGCDFMHVPQCLSPFCQRGSAAANVSLEMESANKNDWLPAQHRSSTEPL